MNITEFMDFDFAWFTTLPGILITGGVVVLLIALIIFIASNKKDKKNNAPEVAQVDNSNLNMPNDGMNMGMPLNDFNNGVDMNMQMGNTPVADFNNNGFNTPDMGAMNPVDNNMNNMDNMNNMNNNFYGQDFNNGMAMNSIPTINNSEVPNYNSATPTNVVDFTAPVTPEPLSVNNDFNTVNQNVEMNNQNNTVVPSVEVPTVPSYNENVNMDNSSVASVTYPEVNVAPVEMSATPEPVVQQPEVVAQPMSAAPEPTTSVEVKPSIYGGVDPANIAPAHHEVKPVIYGGADPLEHTSTLPTMTHEAYNIPTPVAPVAPAPVEMPAVPEEPVVQQPEVVAPQPMPAAPEPVMPSVMPAVEPAVSPMPMTGAEMFNTSDNNGNNEVPSGDSEIETLEF